jgi:hypothetical protein
LKLRGALALALLAAGCAPIPKTAPPPPSAPIPYKPVIGGFALQGALSQGGYAIGVAPVGTVAMSLDGAPIDIAPDGRFLIAFGREAGPQAIVEARLTDGTVVREKVKVAPRDFPIEHVSAPKRPSMPSAEYERIRSAEVARIEAARRVRSPIEGWRQRFMWPVTGRISGLFGAVRVYAGGDEGDPHSGVDIAQPAGTAIVAPADGVVVLASPPAFTLEGNLLIIDHGMGLSSAFLHLSRIDVRPGETVKRGQLIGAVGATGRATGAHLHWGMKWRDVRIDPMLLTGPMPGA